MILTWHAKVRSEFMIADKTDTLVFVCGSEDDINIGYA